jgi:hypothetical protein
MQTLDFVLLVFITFYLLAAGFLARRIKPLSHGIAKARRHRISSESNSHVGLRSRSRLLAAARLKSVTAGSLSRRALS